VKKKKKKLTKTHTINFFHRKTKSQVQNTFQLFYQDEFKGEGLGIFLGREWEVIYIDCVVSKVA